jgi:hypothetical protein
MGYGSSRFDGAARPLADYMPYPTPVPLVFDRIARDPSAPPRTGWPRDPYLDQFEDCRDRGYAGRYRQGAITHYYFVDLPPGPHTQDVAKVVVAEQLCFAGNHGWTPPGTVFALAQAQFTLAELQTWARQMRAPELAASVGYSSARISERDNEVQVGLRDMSQVGLVRDRMRASGIPLTAVAFYYDPEIIWRF